MHGLQQDVEVAILGAMILDNRLIKTTKVNREVFTGRKQVIFDAILALAEENNPVDPLTITARMREKNTFLLGDSQLIAGFINNIPRLENIDYYVSLANDALATRQTGALLKKYEEKLLDGNRGVEILEELKSDINRTSAQTAEMKITNIEDDVNSFIARGLEEGSNRIPTGFTALDEQIGLGLSRSQVTVIAGRPSMGKTALTLSMLDNFLKQDLRIAFFTNDETKDELIGKYLALKLNMDVRKSSNLNMLSRDEMRQAMPVLHELAAKQIRIEDDSWPSIHSIASKSRRLALDWDGLDVILIDYIQSVEMPELRRGSTDDPIGVGLRTLKNVAKELKAVIIAISQINRNSENENREPMMADLRQSGRIEEAAYTILFPYRPNAKKYSPAPEEAKIIIGKHKSAPRGFVKVQFIPHCAKYANA